MTRGAEPPFVPCPNCGGDGRLTAQRSGDWRREPDRYRPDQMVTCQVCGGTGLIPRPGAFEEA
ncbi:MAG: hypothetical protein KDE22_10170 [Rhodobacterales bacterium]|nr:hypothetical protein [Rhodobacterales bacterium]